MPIWDNTNHNKATEMCYRTLAGQCKKAVKSSSLSREKYEDFLERLVNLL